MDNVYLHQFNQCCDDSVYLPLSIGLLKASAISDEYIRQHYCFKELIFNRDPIPSLESYNNPHIACFSLYIWNERISYYVAKKLKETYKSIIIMGGPSVPNDSEKTLRDCGFIDYLIHGEGEVAFVELLKALKNGSDLSQVKGISYIKDGKYYKTGESDKIKNLDSIPSPFLEGIFDNLFDSSSKFSAIWETSRGCPFRCAFCYWGNNQQKISYSSLPRLKKELEWMADHEIEYVWFGDSNFGMTERDLDVTNLIIDCKRRRGYPKSFILNFAKNSGDRVFRISKSLYDAGLHKSATLSFQSMNDSVLDNINRKNIKLSVFKDLQKEYRLANIPTYSELIVPLPGETLQSFIDGLETLLQSGQDQIVVLRLTIIPNTDIASQSYMERFGFKTHMAPVGKPSFIQEYEEIVVSTNTMSLDDCKKALLLSYMVFIHITLKCSYFVLFYFFKTFHINLTDFLLKLRDEINSNPSLYPILAQEDKRLSKYVDDLYSSNNNTVDVSGLPISQDVFWKLSEVTFIVYAIHRDEYIKELEMAINRMFPDCDKDLISELMEYQKNRLVNQSPSNMQKQYNWNFKKFFDSILESEDVKLLREPYLSTMSDQNQYQTFDDFVLYQVRYGKKRKHFIYTEV